MVRCVRMQVHPYMEPIFGLVQAAKVKAGDEAGADQVRGAGDRFWAHTVAQMAVV